MGSEVPLADVAARLEALLPGFSASAAASGEQRRVRHNEYWSRLRPARPLGDPAQPHPGDVVDVDHLLAYAEQYAGRITAKQFGELVEFEELVPYLRALAGEALLVADDALNCIRATADALLAAEDVRLVDGDVIIVGTSSPRVIVVHHEGWVFDLDLAQVGSGRE